MKIVCIADTHVNSTIGLWPPGLSAPDGNPLPLNPFQQWLWSRWLEFCGFTDSLGERIVEVNGDLGDGKNTDRVSQTMTFVPSLMRQAVIKVYEPLIDRMGVRSVYVVKGTEFHDGLGGTSAEDVADNFNAVPDPDTGAKSRWILWLEHEGKLFNFTHHIGISSDYPLTAIRKEIDRAKREHVDHGQPMPDCQVRSHRHVSDVAVDGRFVALVTPAFQLKTAYITKHNPVALPDIGGTILSVEEGEIKWKFVLYPLPRPTIESTSRLPNSLKP